MELIALKPIADSVGSIKAGQQFSASGDIGISLIRNGQAILTTQHYGQVTGGRWQDATAVILGGGPSVQPGDFELVRAWRFAAGDYNRKVAVINTSYQFALWADLLYAADDKWWDFYWKDIEARFKGELWTQALNAHRRYKINHITCERRDGLSQTRGIIHHGGHSGYQTMGLLHEFGVREMILVGFDMQKLNGQTHHHGNHPKPLSQAGPYDYWLPNFNKLSGDLKRAGVKVVNATRITAIRVFPQVPLEDALR